ADREGPQGGRRARQNIRRIPGLLRAAWVPPLMDAGYNDVEYLVTPRGRWRYRRGLGRMGEEERRKARTVEEALDRIPQECRELKKVLAILEIIERNEEHRYRGADRKLLGIPESSH
ncbi:MAG: hypothetical protein ACP5MH_11120, partial [Thermoproteus sp.]